MGIRKAAPSVVNYRALRGQFVWGGMIPDGDPASLPPNRPRLLVNTRRSGGGFSPRPGFAKLNSVAFTGSSVVDLADHQITAHKKLLVIGDGCPGVSASVGFYVGWIDHDQDPYYQNATYYDTATLNVTAEIFSPGLSRDLYMGVDATLRVLHVVGVPYGDVALGSGGRSQDFTKVTLPAGYTEIGYLKAWDGKLFVAADGGAGASGVFTFDGVTFRSDLTTINALTGFGVFRELLVAGHAASGPNLIRVRATGSSPGTWSTVAPGAGVASFYDSAEYKDVLYITTGNEDIYSFNGTALTRILAATTGVGAGSLTRGIAVGGGNLYILYQTSGNVVRVAKFNGTTWTGTEKNLTTQDATTTIAYRLAFFQGNLFAACGGTGGGRLLAAPPSGTTGTWTKIVPSASFNGSINQLLVF